MRTTTTLHSDSLDRRMLADVSSFITSALGALKDGRLTACYVEAETAHKRLSAFLELSAKRLGMAASAEHARKCTNCAHFHQSDTFGLRCLSSGEAMGYRFVPCEICLAYSPKIGKEHPHE